uniref:Uncharacterized protein n=1 Tax=Schlesneria paludicola TaxID=360056 RepID=A0A7C2JZB2_9PLAN
MTGSDAPPLPRREFARALAVGVSGCALGLAGHPNAVAQEPPAEKPKLPTVPELILTQIVVDYPGEHWNEDTLGSVLGDVRADLARGRLLKSVPLTNGDEPGPIFAAYRAPVQGQP